MVGITVCRGCCCGTARKRPEVDHPGQLAALQELVSCGAAGDLRISECLGPCERANVLVVRPDARARHSGARPVWIGDLTDADLPKLLDWIRLGGPGHAPLPAKLQPLQFRPPRRPR